MAQATAEQLEAGIAEVRRAPADAGRLELIVARPAEERRELLDRATLDEREGLVGDMWSARPAPRAPTAGRIPRRS